MVSESQAHEMGQWMGVLLVIAFVLTMIAAWGTHIWYCLAHGYGGLLFLGLILPLIGWIHGIMIWFGWVA